MLYGNKLLFVFIIIQIINDCICLNTTHNPIIKTTKTTTSKANKTQTKLPPKKQKSGMQPEEYALKIIPSYEKDDFTFTGKLKVKLRVIKDTKKIRMHSKYLKFTDEDVRVLYKEHNIGITDLKFDNKTETFNITTSEYLEVKERPYTLIINYSGEISDDEIHGFYRTWYMENGKLKWVRVIQMVPNYARTIFPCFDVPYIKSNFSISVAKPSASMNTVSNMNKHQVIKLQKENYFVDVYPLSPLMPANMLGLGIFDFSSSSIGGKSFIKVWAQSCMLSQAYYILNSTEQIMKFMEEFTSIVFKWKFGKTKLDIIALPEFIGRRTESWGLMILKESNIFYKPNASSTYGKQHVSITVAVELAKHWFGNLVYQKTWEFVWLKDALSLYVGYYITSLMEPKWQMMDQFVVKTVQTALGDSYSNNPVYAFLTKAHKFEDTAIDVLSLRKAASIVRTIDAFTGIRKFKDAIRKYLKNGQLAGMVTPDMLWTAFDETLPEDFLPKDLKIKDVLHGWVTDNAYPLITVTRNYEDRIATITQEEYYKVKRDKPKTWFVPLTYESYNDPGNFSFYRQIQWMRPQNTTIDVKINTDNWVVFNVNQIGYYRVNYDIQNWTFLYKQLISLYSRIQRINRAQIIDDSFALARDGKIPYKIPFVICQYLRKEGEYIPWYSAVRTFVNLMNDYQNTPAASLIMKYIENVTVPVYKRVRDRVKETHEDDLISSLITTFACTMEMQECVYDMKKLFSSLSRVDYVRRPDLVNLKEPILCIGLKYGTQKTWDEVFTQYQKTDVASERPLLIRAMGCPTDSKIIYNYLMKLIAKDKPPFEIRRHDFTSVLASVLMQPKHTNIAVKFLIKEYKKLMNINGNKTLKSFFLLLSIYITNAQDYQELKQFHVDNQVKLGELNDTMKNTLLKIKNHIDWAKINSRKIICVLSDCTGTDFGSGLKPPPGATTSVYERLRPSSTISNKSKGYCIIFMLYIYSALT